MSACFRGSVDARDLRGGCRLRSAWLGAVGADLTLCRGASHASKAAERTPAAGLGP